MKSGNCFTIFSRSCYGVACCNIFHTLLEHNTEWQLHIILKRFHVNFRINEVVAALIVYVTCFCTRVMRKEIETCQSQDGWMRGWCDDFWECCFLNIFYHFVLNPEVNVRESLFKWKVETPGCWFWSIIGLNGPNGFKLCQFVSNLSSALFP